MAGKRSNGRRIKMHRSYDVAEAAKAVGVSRGTIRRYLKDGLHNLSDQRPVLILGQDLKEFLDAKRKPRQSCRIDQCYCMSCKAPRRPAFDEVEFQRTNAGRGNVRALCEICSTVMHKVISADGLKALKAILNVTPVLVETRLDDGDSPCTNEHFNRESETHA